MRSIPFGSLDVAQTTYLRNGFKTPGTLDKRKGTYHATVTEEGQFTVAFLPSNNTEGSGRLFASAELPLTKNLEHQALFALKNKSYASGFHPSAATPIKVGILETEDGQAHSRLDLITDFADDVFELRDLYLKQQQSRTNLKAAFA